MYCSRFSVELVLDFRKVSVGGLEFLRILGRQNAELHVGRQSLVGLVFLKLLKECLKPPDSVGSIACLDGRTERIGHLLIPHVAVLGSARLLCKSLQDIGAARVERIELVEFSQLLQGFLRHPFSRRRGFRSSREARENVAAL